MSSRRVAKRPHQLHQEAVLLRVKMSEKRDQQQQVPKEMKMIPLLIRSVRRQMRVVGVEEVMLVVEATAGDVEYVVIHPIKEMVNKAEEAEDLLLAVVQGLPTQSADRHQFGAITVQQ